MVSVSDIFCYCQCSAANVRDDQTVNDDEHMVQPLGFNSSVKLTAAGTPQ